MGLAEFHTAVFLGNGELEGTGRRAASALSDPWLQVAGVLLAEGAHPGGARVPFENLDHLSVRSTIANGSALVTYHSRQELVASSLLFKGEYPATEVELMELFIASVAAAMTSQGGVPAVTLTRLLALGERPLHAVFVWGHPQVSNDDHDLIAELSDHVAGAFLTPENGGALGGAAQQ